MWQDKPISDCGLFLGAAPTPPANFGDIMVGVEVEAELGRNRLDLPPGFAWRQEHEGSLRRGGIEFISQEPTPLSRAREQLVQLAEPLRVAINTFRAAVHCHVDARWQTPRQVVSSYALACLYEPSIYKMVGKGRDESNFCTPAAGCPQYLRTMSARLTEPAWKPFMISAQRHRKYTGINLQPLAKFGSIEFRHLQTPVYNDHPMRAIRDIDTFVAAVAGIVWVGSRYNYDKDWTGKLDQMFRMMGRMVPQLERPCTGTILGVSAVLGRPVSKAPVVSLSKVGKAAPEIAVVRPNRVYVLDDVLREHPQAPPPPEPINFENDIRAVERSPREVVRWRTGDEIKYRRKAEVLREFRARLQEIVRTYPNVDFEAAVAMAQDVMFENEEPANNNVNEVEVQQLEDQ